MGFASLLDAGAARATGPTVVLRNTAFNPSSVSISVGQTVTWDYEDSGTPHSVTSDTGLFDSNPTCGQSSGTCLTSNGQTFQFTFTAPGTYGYHCRIHSFMTGVVDVSSGPLTVTGSSAGIARRERGVLTAGSPARGVLATFTDTSPGVSFDARVTWGDGTGPTSATVTRQSDGSFAVTASHAYSEDGMYRSPSRLPIARERPERPRLRR